MAKKLTWLEKLETILPGFSGYKKRELIREDDRLVRDYVFNTLREARNRIEEAASSIVDLNFTLARKLNNIASVIGYMADRVKFAETGYAPHFHRVKVGMEELEHIKEIDDKLIGLAESVKSAAHEIARLAPKAPISSEKIGNLTEKLTEIEEVLEQRIKVLRGWISEVEE